MKHEMKFTEYSLQFYNTVIYSFITLQSYNVKTKQRQKRTNKRTQPLLQWICKFKSLTKRYKNNKILWHLLDRLLETLYLKSYYFSVIDSKK